MEKQVTVNESELCALKAKAQKYDNLNKTIGDLFEKEDSNLLIIGERALIELGYYGK